MIRTGLGVSMLPMWIVDRDLKDGHLRLIQQVEPPLHSKIALVRRRSNYIPQAVEAFIADARKIEWKNPRLCSTPARTGQGQTTAR
jgi:DNA-binding transcriptional LysR family regulator